MIDLFWDLSRSDHEHPGALLEWWSPLGKMGHVCVARGAESFSTRDPDGRWTDLAGSPAQALGTAMRRAANAGHALALLTGPWHPTEPEDLVALESASGLDVMVGTTQPRFIRAGGHEVWALPGGEGSAGRLIRRQELEWMNATLFTPELPAALVVLSVDGVRASQPPASDAADPMGEVLARIRRRGFRNLVCNRIAVDYPLGDPYRDHVSEAGARIPDADREDAEKWLAATPQIRLERLLAGARSGDRSRLLVDCRPMAAVYNGTSEAILGLLTGLDALVTPDWTVEVVASNQVARFHRLAERFPRLVVRHELVEESYLAAVHLTQPWHMRTIGELHEHACFLFFYIFDTIAWDIIYAAPDGLDAVWRFAATYGDGLLYDSDFSRQRFETRFPPAPSLTSSVTYLSLAPGDYQVGASESPYPPPYIVIMGNSYDHKDVDGTSAILAREFPDTRIVAFGGKESPSPSVTLIASGEAEQSAVDSLLANAAVIVYPSYYEGFGLPVAFGLANGRTVIVRRSALWQEFADHTRMPGALVEFGDEHDLVTAVGQALNGTTPEGMPQGRALEVGAGPPDWRACARTLLETVERAAARKAPAAWLARDTALAARAGSNAEIQLRPIKEALSSTQVSLSDVRMQLASATAHASELASDLAAGREDAAEAAAALAMAAEDKVRLDQTVERLALERASLERELDLTHGTLSWRITSPLRRLRQ